MTKLYLTWQEVRDRLTALNVRHGFRTSMKFYGIPRGGAYLSAMQSHQANTPEAADVLIDDLVDSGATKARYADLYPDKPFVALIEQEEHEALGKPWVVFPWEVAEGAEEASVEENVLRILQRFDDPTREGLRETPKRYVKFLEEFLSPPDFTFTTFASEGMDEMIIQKDIEFYSLCEHHLAPFHGKAHVAYIPNGKIVGLSKLARTVELYSRRFQNQERITSQIAERLQEELHAKGVAVVLEAQHLCMAMRGVRKNATTTTSKLLGFFKDDAKARAEFLDLIRS